MNSLKLWGLLVVKNSSVNAGDIRDVSSIPGSGQSSEGRHGNPLQYSCLENPMDRGAWQATVHSIKKKQLSMHTGMCYSRMSISHLYFCIKIYMDEHS